MRGLPQKQNARRADKIRLCGHLGRYKKIVKKTYIIFCGSGKDFIRNRLDREKPGEQRYKDHADYGYTSTGHELFYPQIGVGKRLDGGRRRVKKYLWSF
ncbi:hypothetical protein RTO_04880 [[Ruminococcus] torques L2-14]|uniref:Uncharacterized protein n=1 Tax=[Ruminococcus] torques L2-14 TaxID=657313 RepID=D4M1Y5_9FIRM|nr:hypothetical protein RTO_04880 [[Ruminococcus] torques L2-14]